MVLWSGCFGGWVKHLTRKQINPFTWTDCKLFLFLFYFGRHYSSTLLVLMSFEKCFAVYFPLKSKTVSTVRTAKWATGIVGVMVTNHHRSPTTTMARLSLMVYLVLLYYVHTRQSCSRNKICGNSTNCKKGRK